MPVDRDLAAGVLGCVGTLWSEEGYHDLKISLGDYEFSCPRFILCACSEFFRVLLHTERNAFREDCVKIDGISPQTFGHILNAVYGGKDEITEDNVLEIWYAVHHLEIRFLIRKCEQFVIDHLSLDLIAVIFKMAKALKSKNVADSCLAFIARYFDHFAQTESFLELSGESFLHILKSEELVTDKPDILVESILKWVNQTPAVMLRAESAHLSEGAVGGTSESESDVEIRASPLHHDSKPSETGTNVLEMRGAGDKDVETCYKKTIQVSFKPADMGEKHQGGETERREYIAQLLQCVELTAVGNDWFKMLLQSPVILTSHEATSLVHAAVTTRFIDGQASAFPAKHDAISANDSVVDNTQVQAKLKDEEDINVVALFVQNSTVVAFDIENNDYHKVFVTNHKVRQIIWIENALFLNIREKEQLLTMDKRHTITYRWILSRYKSLRNVQHFNLFSTQHYDEYVHLISFKKRMYQITKRAINILGSNFNFHECYCVCEFSEEIAQIPLISAAAFQDSVLLLKGVSHGNLCVYRFNTVNRILSVLRIIKTQQNAVSFVFKDQFFILCSNGQLCKVDTSENAWKICDLKQLWDFTLDLKSADVYDDILYIFTKNLTYAGTLPSRVFGLFPKVKFINLMADNRPNCVIAPLQRKDWFK